MSEIQIARKQREGGRIDVDEGKRQEVLISERTVSCER